MNRDKRFYQSLDDEYPEETTSQVAMNQAQLDIQRLTLASIKACITSLEANLPLSQVQLKELDEMYLKLTGMVKEAAWDIKEVSSDG